MSGKYVFPVLITILFTGLATLVSDAQDKHSIRRDHHRNWQEQLREFTDDDFAAFAEYGNLNSFASHLDESACNFLRSEGWREVLLVGTYLVDSIGFYEYNFVVADSGHIYHMKPFQIVEHPPPPGYYWARNILSSWRIIFPDGRDISLSRKK